MPALCGGIMGNARRSHLTRHQRTAPEPVPDRSREARCGVISRVGMGCTRNDSLERGVVVAISQPDKQDKQEEQTMNWDRVEGNWKTFKGQVQQKWGKLTDDDLDVIEGKRTELAGRLQERYGYAKDEAEKNIDTWLKNVN
jgi:uncharacterized protein YjbJ (UPF0337 family)